MKVLIKLVLLLAIATACRKSGSGTSSEGNTSDSLSTKVLNEKLSYPWEVLWGPDNMLWLTERGGKVSRVDPVTGVQTTLLQIPDVKSMGEGGLLGMVLHPDFSKSPQVFLAYNYDKNGTYTEKIVRYDYTNGSLNNPLILLDNIPAASIHDGCRLAFSPDKKLYISTGDASNSARAQDKNSLSGKIFRINPDGSIPADNPVSGSPVWSYGHRNPQGLVFVGDKLFSSEHGNSTDDEINIIERNRNFGWPNVEGFCNTSAEQSFCTSNNVKEPIYAWSPTIAPSGLDYYNSDYLPRLKNSLLLCVLKNRVLIQLKLDDSKNKITETKEFFKDEFGRLRDLCISPDGKIYFITSNGTNDKLVVITK
ncbi:PQQ-dependent sugar dehydrogenase [Pedobacter sp. HMF7647]|uniref:PQQ-dependent sugar dehydrogenase n=1 Tax=Hufsiella arboris TaxID=2695275 RepID=A0A7K1Y6J4_9SPHI|nr:PQQ-dependent sugar dehydrogenase [Hufsiella arboris]MXV50183.1 PQQ-dependent sugar dehydrogenase [Hufsiella arboris]